MKRVLRTICNLMLIASLLFGCFAIKTPASAASITAVQASSQPSGGQPTDNKPPKKENGQPKGPAVSGQPDVKQGGSQYTLEQAMSDKAQLSTIAFSALAFLTGNDGADTFFPPGKVADFFGFQYMRDVDQAGYGHNTTFLSKAADNVLSILNDEQKAKLVALAKEQSTLYADFAYNRYTLINAFRRELKGSTPSASASLNETAVAEYTSRLYGYDAKISLGRANIVGEIIASFTDEQKAYLAKMQFDDSSTWPDASEDQTLKKGLTNDQFVCVMTYASELFSWYKGSVDADTYFCPERHGTYFGGFYMKDYPAMNNPDYFISTTLTGDSGEGLLNILTPDQQKLITGIIDEQRDDLNQIAVLRREISQELRKAMTGSTIDEANVTEWIGQYGALDGKVSCLYATRFSQVNATLTEDQRTALVKLRNQDVLPTGGYYFSTPVPMPAVPDTDFLFGVGSMPDASGTLSAPSSFLQAANANPPKNNNGGK